MIAKQLVQPFGEFVSFICRFGKTYIGFKN